MEMRCYYYQLPDEIVKKILSFLSVVDLWHMLQVSRAMYRFADESILEFYQNAFKTSCLWEHLPQIVASGSLSNYFNAFVPAEWLEIIQIGELDSLNQLAQSACQWVYSKDLVSDISIQQIPKDQEFLLTHLQSQSIQDFLSAPYLKRESILEERKRRLVVARTYRHVEETYTLLLLFLLVQRSPEENVLFFVADGRLSRWLSSLGIVGLTYPWSAKKLLSNLVDCSLGNHTLSSQFSFDEGISFQSSASEILYRLTDNECRHLLAGSQCPVLVNAINHKCFPIIDSLGPRALEKVVEENPDDNMLVVLLERLGAERLSKALASGSEKNFPKVVNGCPRFMQELLPKLTLVQMCEMVELMGPQQLVSLLNSQKFIEFLTMLDAPSQNLPITYRSNELLLHFSRLESYFAAQIISTRSAQYLKARDILVFLKEGRVIWNAFEKFNMLNKFTQIKDFIELCWSCCWDDPYLASLRKKVEDYGRCKRKEINKFNPDPLDLTYWKVFTDYRLDTLGCWSLERAAQACIPRIHVKLLDKINRLWVQKKEEQQAQKLLEESGNSSTDESQESDEEFSTEANIGDSDVPKTVSSPELNKTLEQNENILSTGNEISILESVPDLTSPKSTIFAEIPQKPDVVFQPLLSKQSKQLNSVSSQGNIAMNIGLSIAKGLLVGLLVMSITILLLMFINYEVNALLVDTIVSDVFVGGIAGAFSWVFASIYFLVDANVCAASTANCINEEDNPTNQCGITIQGKQAIHRTDPSCGNQPFFADNTMDTSVSFINIKSNIFRK